MEKEIVIMRWILVFIFLYVIPLVVLFKNYKKFSRACIYACTYVVLATTIVISNMYISGIKQLENNNSMVMNYKEIYTSSLDVNNVEQDLLKIIPYEYLKDVNHLFMWLGRDCCKAPNPNCENCILKDNCTFHKN